MTIEADDLAALRQTLLAEGIEGATELDARGAYASLGRGGSWRTTPRPSELPGASLSHDPDADYTLEYVLGEGGMATVWLARQRALGREVAVKRAHSQSERGAQQLLHEAMITGQL